MSLEVATILMSALAVGVSGLTAWLTLFRRGSLRMTRPKLVFFGPDGSRGPAKVFVRAFLLSTGHRGVVVEGLWARLKSGTDSHTFGSWISRTTENLSRESGMFVGPEGVAADHHFLVPRGSSFVFGHGTLRLEIYAKILGRKRPIRLWEDDFSLTVEEADHLNRLDAGVFYDWQPHRQEYERTLDRNRTAELNWALQERVKLKPRDLQRLAGPTFAEVLGEGQ